MAKKTKPEVGGLTRRMENAEVIRQVTASPPAGRVLIVSVFGYTEQNGPEHEVEFFPVILIRTERVNVYTRPVYLTDEQWKHRRGHTTHFASDRDAVRAGWDLVETMIRHCPMIIQEGLLQDFDIYLDPASNQAVELVTADWDREQDKSRLRDTVERLRQATFNKMKGVPADG